VDRVLPVVQEVQDHLLELDAVHHAPGEAGREVEGDFDVVLSDLRMPRVGGEELFARVVGEKPDYRHRFAFITGDVGALEPDAAGQIAEAPLVSKPFDLDELDRVVQRVARIPSGQPC